MKHSARLKALVSLLPILTCPIYANDHTAPLVRGWPGGMTTMGSIAEGPQNTFSYQHLLSRRLPGKTEALFTYAMGGGSDTYSLTVHAVPQKSMNLVKLSRLLESKNRHVHIMPVVVVYTSGASNSTSAMQIDFGLDPKHPENLKQRFANLIIITSYLQSQKDATHPVPATLIINPDFLGEIHKITHGQWAPFNPETIKLKLHAAIVNGYKEANQPLLATIPATFSDEAGLNAYLDAIDWIIKTQAPDVPFGWMDNIWAGDARGHLWIHHPGQLDTHVDAEVQFLKNLHLYARDNPWKPDFIAFDKYERDNLGPVPNNLNNGYTYNTPAWNTYFGFVSSVAKNLNNTPVMLFQLPGGHIQVSGDVDFRNDHGSTAPDYLFGDSHLVAGLAHVKPYITRLTFTHPRLDYNTGSTRVTAYLQEGNPNWQKGHTAILKNDRIFGILWGGGSTTSIVGLDASRDDSGWLYNKIRRYYASAD